MGIDDDVWSHTVCQEWHVLFGNYVADGALLSVATAALVTNDRFAQSAHPHFTELVSIAVSLDIVLVDIRVLAPARPLPLPASEYPNRPLAPSRCLSSRVTVVAAARSQTSGS